MHMDVYDMISLKYIQNFNLLSRLLALTVLVLNGSLFRNLTLVSYCRRARICIVFLLRSLRLVVGRHTQLP